MIFAVTLLTFGGAFIFGTHRIAAARVRERP
jgi:hypothetical protein